jgi:hypothetical protein
LKNYDGIIQKIWENRNVAKENSEVCRVKRAEEEKSLEVEASAL